jgi:hypothetical protein
VIESGWIEKEKEEDPRIMMIRVQSLEEREEQRIAEFQEKGRQLDEEYNEMIRTHNEGQENLNRVARDCELKPNQEGLVEALIEQVIFDNQTTKKYDEVYQKERNLRREVTSYLQRRSLQIPEEPPQPSRWTLKPEEPSRKEEIMQAQHQVQRTQTRWPPLPGWTSTPQSEVPWTMPPTEKTLQRNDAMQAESSLKRPRENVENIKTFDPNLDYDSYCDNNKINEKRKAMSMFIVNLMIKDILREDEVLDLIIHFQNIIHGHIDTEGKTGVIDEIAENIFILVTSSISKLSSHERWNVIVDNVSKFSKLKSKEHVSLSSRSAFKHMDILDIYRKSQISQGISNESA